MERLLDYRDCMKLGEVDGKKIGCTVSLLVSLFVIFILFHARAIPAAQHEQHVSVVQEANPPNHTKQQDAGAH